MRRRSRAKAIKHKKNIFLHARTSSCRALCSFMSTAVVAAASCIAWSNAEGLILLGMRDGSICVCDVSTGLQNSLLKCPQVAAVTKVIVSLDNNLMAAVIESLFHVHVFSLLSSALLVSLTFSGDPTTLQWSISGSILQDDGKGLWPNSALPQCHWNAVGD